MIKLQNGVRNPGQLIVGLQNLPRISGQHIVPLQNLPPNSGQALVPLQNDARLSGRHIVPLQELPLNSGQYFAARQCLAQTVIPAKAGIRIVRNGAPRLNNLRGFVVGGFRPSPE